MHLRIGLELSLKPSFNPSRPSPSPTPGLEAEGYLLTRSQRRPPSSGGRGMQGEVGAESQKEGGQKTKSRAGG
jgi:hypothetical protein